LPTATITHIEIKEPKTNTGLISAHFGRIFVFCAKVDSDYACPSGTVGFYSGTHLMGTAELEQGEASLQVQLGAYETVYPSAGLNTFYAAYVGNGDFAPSQSNAITANILPMPTTLTVDQNVTQVACSGEVLTLVTATLGPDSDKLEPNGIYTFVVNQGTVSFLTNNTISGIGEIGNSYFAAAVLRGVPVGSNQLSAVFSGNNNFLKSQSPSVTVTTSLEGTQPAVSAFVNLQFVVSVDRNAGVPDKVNLVATATMPGAGSIPGTSSIPGGNGNKVAGNIEFFIDCQSVGRLALDAQNTASLDLDNVAVGARNAFAALTDVSGKLVMVSSIRMFQVNPKLPLPNGKPDSGTPSLPIGQPVGKGFNPRGF
jgi:hypothetical protein